MKTSLAVVLFPLTAGILHAQNATVTQGPRATPYSIVSRDANSRVFQRTFWEKRPDGEWVSHLRSYTELETGMHYKGPDGEWIESKEEIDPAPGGGFQATQGQHKAYLPADLYDSVIDVVEPSGEHLKSRPLGINYFDGTNSDQHCAADELRAGGAQGHQRARARIPLFALGLCFQFR